MPHERISKDAMLKLIFISLLLSSASICLAFNASDNASNYGGGWTNLSNNGTGFNAWGFTTDAGDIVGIADSTVGAGDINTGINSFRIASDNGNSLDVFRSFGDGISLGTGYVLSFDLSVNYRNGNKGFDLRNGGTGEFNFRIANDEYIFGSTNLSTDENWNYVSDGVYGLEFEFVTELLMNAKITRTSLGTPSENRTFEIPNVALSGAIDNFKFYVTGTDTFINPGDSENNSLYFNNLTVVPEPSAYGLFFGALALVWVARRR